LVFEHLFPERLLERKEWTAFTLAVIYSTIAIVIARLLFPANSGIVSVIFVSIFLIPYFQTLLKREERQEKREKRQTFAKLFSDNADIIRIYAFIFLGVYLTYMIYAFIAPSLGYNVGSVFREQLSLESVRGGATFSFGQFFTILINNWWVLLACFLIALIAGDGAVFFVIWNASTWGTIFGYRAMEAGLHTGTSALWLLLIVFLITLPHVLLEGGAYILAAIAGGVLSDEIVEKSTEIREFVIYFICAALGFGLFYAILVFTVGNDVVVGLLAIAGALFLLYWLHAIFSSSRDRMVFKYNFYLFLLAVGVFVVAAVVETIVLLNATPLREIYLAAYG
jgi:uncharacterized membrane protein SpoIIM required for sporulation